MKAIIVHGTKGSPQGNWFPWLAAKLEELGVESIIPKLPTPENQTLINWQNAFKEQCGEVTSDTILIGHSCGAVLIMRLLEESIQAAACTVLAAPPYKEIGIPEYDALNSTFLDKPFKWSNIVANAGELFYFMAENDQYVPQDQLLTIAESLKVNPIVISGGGHLNSETGFSTFPQLLNCLNGFLRQQKSL